MQVTASSNDTLSNPNSEPQNIDDENIQTQWQAANADSQWVQIDMAKQIAINKIVIDWGNQGYATQYSVQVSNDLNNWQVLKTVSNGTGGVNNVETLNNLQGSGRYLMFLLQTRGAGAFTIADIYVYGLPVATGVNATGTKIPKSYTLYQNYPNPFNPTTVIDFNISEQTYASIKIFNVLGQKVKEIYLGLISAGIYKKTIDMTGFASGIYFYQLNTGRFEAVKKMLLLQ